MNDYLDDFGNLKSSVSEERRCFFCGSTQRLEIHHIFGGSLRDKSTKYGLFVYLCPKCHHELHFGKNSRKMQDKLKEKGQEAFERTHTHEEFMRLFHRNWRR